MGFCLVAYIVEAKNSASRLAQPTLAGPQSKLDDDGWPRMNSPLLQSVRFELPEYQGGGETVQPHP